jgi:hypothetical protein
MAAARRNVEPENERALALDLDLAHATRNLWQGGVGHFFQPPSFLMS